MALLGSPEVGVAIPDRDAMSTQRRDQLKHERAISTRVGEENLVRRAQLAESELFRPVRISLWQSAQRWGGRPLDHPNRTKAFRLQENDRDRPRQRESGGC